MQRSVAGRDDLRLILAEEMNAAASRRQMPTSRAPFTLRAKLLLRGSMREQSVVPDLVFGLQLADGERRNFMVEIDRGTMPVRRSDPDQTIFEGKMRIYLAAHAAKEHQRQFGWRNFRVLVVTTDQRRIRSMIEALRRLRIAHSAGPSLVFVHHLRRPRRC